MPTLDLRSDRYRDQLLGCWIGKNAGGTLGAPVERVWGQEEPFDLSWYPSLPEGGIPNDDLEMQLIWLAALKQVGPGLVAADLARYWLDHIGYNWDEYGLSKANLRLGLTPPISGYFNNWFTDCMGCPIRSEVWACVAPGFPRIAAQYAYQDAICDHAGGESIFGELFNAATQSAAFVVSDSSVLLDIGLSYVPADSLTARAINAARTAHSEGLTWQQARARVLALSDTKVAQYSPFNIGFQVIGWLYGSDFGDVICTTVNCGYDTDSSGGSIGSLWGILAGRSGLPTKWIEPFGLEISTNESWQGVRHISDGAAPIPTMLPELVDDLIAQSAIVLSHHGVELANGVVEIREADLYADDTVTQLWNRSTAEVRYDAPQYDLTVDYLGDPLIVPGGTKQVAITIHNPHPDEVVGSLRWILPGGWGHIADSRFTISAHDRLTIVSEISAPASPRNQNTLYAAVTFDGYPVEPAVPVVLVGAPVWRWTRSAEGLESPPELPGQTTSSWSTAYGSGNRTPLRELATVPGRIYLRTFLDVPSSGEVRIGTNATVPFTVWVDTEELQDERTAGLLRPSLNDTHPVTSLGAGWHEVTIAFDIDVDHVGSVEAHMLLSSPDRLVTANTVIERSGQPEFLGVPVPAN